MDNAAPWRHRQDVPLIENKLPSTSPKALARRNARALVILETQRVTTPARLVLDARDEARRLHDRLRESIPTAPPSELLALATAAVKVRAQLLDLLSLPTRPRGESRRRLLTLPPGDVSTVEPLPPDPRTIPGVPPLDA